MIYTSYFANWRKFPKDLKTVSISRFNQKWIKVDEHELDLAPSAEILLKYKNNEINEEEYDKAYLIQLNKLNPEMIKEKFNNKILLCYEKEGEYCHRKTLSDWLKEKGIEIEELS